MKYWKTFLIIIVLIIVGACKDTGNNVAGVIEFVTGQAFISSAMIANNEEKSIALGDIVRFEDSIRTEDNSGVEMLLKDYGILRIGEKTIFKVSDLSNKKRVEVRVQSGKAGMFIKKTTPQRELVITTPTVIAAVRGTKFLVSVGDGTASKIALFDGAIELKDFSGHAFILDKPGEIKVKKGQQINARMIEALSAESIAEMKALEEMSDMETSNAPTQPIHPLKPELPGDPGK